MRFHQKLLAAVGWEKTPLTVRTSPEGASLAFCSSMDTVYAAQAMYDIGCSIVLTLGGDGTNRAFAKGWQNVPLVPISTGTNNVFPGLVEGTVAGAAAGLIAAGKIELASVSNQVKATTIEIENEGEIKNLVFVSFSINDDYQPTLVKRITISESDDEQEKQKTIQSVMPVLKGFMSAISD